MLFDRGIVDAVTALERLPRVPVHAARGVRRYRYARRVLPSWAALFSADAERRHSFEDAVAEHDAVVASYRAKGYDTVTDPRAPLEERAAFFEAALAHG